METKDTAKIHKNAIEALNLWGEPDVKIKFVPDGYSTFHYEVQIFESYMDEADVKMILDYAEENDLHVELYARQHLFQFSVFGGQSNG